MLMLYEIANVQQENTGASLIVPPSSQISGASFVFLTDHFLFLQSHRIAEPEWTLETMQFKPLVLKLKKWKIRDVTCFANITQPVDVPAGTGTPVS